MDRDGITSGNFEFFCCSINWFGVLLCVASLRVRSLLSELPRHTICQVCTATILNAINTGCSSSGGTRPSVEVSRGVIFVLVCQPLFCSVDCLLLSPFLPSLLIYILGVKKRFLTTTLKAPSSAASSPVTKKAPRAPYSQDPRGPTLSELKLVSSVRGKRDFLLSQARFGLWVQRPPSQRVETPQSIVPACEAPRCLMSVLRGGYSREETDVKKKLLPHPRDPFEKGSEGQCRGSTPLARRKRAHREKAPN